jgi:hypothetical protein
MRQLVKADEAAFSKILYSQILVFSVSGAMCGCVCEIRMCELGVHLLARYACVSACLPARHGCVCVLPYMAVCGKLRQIR